MLSRSVSLHADADIKTPDRKQLIRSGSRLLLCQITFHRLIRDLWQRRAEELFIPRPEVYQRLDFVIKLNRRGKAQVG